VRLPTRWRQQVRPEDVRLVPGARQDGTLTCTPSGDGTHVDWLSSYTIPARVGGKVLEVLSAPLMCSLAFRKILADCAKALES
jgi:hypothetical protein